jgi:hypothetical protein
MMHRRAPRLIRLLLAPPFLAAIALALCPREAAAQGRRWSFSAEVGGGTMLHDFDHTSLNLSTPTLSVSPRIGFRVIGPLVVQVSGLYGQFFRQYRAIPLVGATAGVRVEPAVGTVGRVWVDANAGVYLPGSVARPGFDVGAGFAFTLTPSLSIGPYVRFAHVWEGRQGRATLDLPYSPTAGQDTDSIHWWTAGVWLTVNLAPHPHPAPAPPPTEGVTRP